MEPPGSAPHSQEPCPYPEPDRSSLCPVSNLSKIHFNIILPSTPGASKRFLFFCLFVVAFLKYVKSGFGSLLWRC